MVILSIIIPTYNRCDYLVETLSSIHAQEGVSGQIEILVIDNASSDDTAKMVADFQDEIKFPLRYINEPRNGLHYCRHTGAKTAYGKILVYIDDDIIADPRWLVSYLTAYKDPQTMAVGGRVLPIWEAKPEDWVSQMPSDYLSLLDYGDQVRPIMKREGINGCNYSVRREVLFQVGGFHPDSFADPKFRWLRGDGEAGLTKKIRASGGKVMYVPDALVWHKITPERLTPEYFRRRGRAHGIENAFTFSRRWRCSLWSIGILIFSGTLLSNWHHSRRWINKEHSVRRLQAEIQSLRYQTIAEYGLRLMRDPTLRNHVTRKTYLEPEDECI